MSETLEEVVYEEPGRELARVEAQPPTLFGTTDPAAVIAKASAAAEPLAACVRKQHLAVNIQGREHVKVEGWTLLGSMLGVFPVCVWTRQLVKDSKEHGWEARVEARTRSGDLVGAAEAQCTRDENQWSWTPSGRNGQPQQPRDDYALRSMAQTRATSKALRQPLGFVMQLAGFEATPAEEMPQDAAPVDDSPITDPAAVKLTFGKHSGKPIGEVPRQYLGWWMQQSEPTRADQIRQRRAVELFLSGDAEPTAAADTDEIPF